MPVYYRRVEIDGLSVFYRESGPADAPTILLLHGFPSSSRMYEPLMSRLSDNYRLIAPDYVGFGYSGAPIATEYSYTFERLAHVVMAFVDALGLQRYAMYLHDYGGPIGMRLAEWDASRIVALVIQNAVLRDEGLGPLWETRRRFWQDRAPYELALRENFFSIAATRQRHVGSNGESETINPDRWFDEFAFLNRPGQFDIQADLFYSYQTNVARYNEWQAWLRAHKPPTLIVWGRYDRSFMLDEVAACQRDLPDAEVHIIDAGHFAVCDRPSEIARIIRTFSSALLHSLYHSRVAPLRLTSVERFESVTFSRC